MTWKTIGALFVCLIPALCGEPVTPERLAEDHRRAVSLATEGKLDEALELFGCTYARALGAGKSRLAAQAAGYLGAIHRFQGRPARAIPLLRFAKREFGVGSADAALVSAQLGAALAQDGDLPGAERELRAAGANASARAHLAAVLIERRKFPEAAAVAREVLRHAKADDLASISVRAVAHLSLARVLVTVAPEEADLHFRGAMESYARLPLADHPDAIAAADDYEAFRKRQHAGRSLRPGKSALRGSP